MRLFIAIDLDEGARGKIAGIINQLKGGGFDVRWVEPRNVHITLKFLGEVREEQLNGLEDKISGVLGGVKSFGISIGNVGYFGSPHYIRVIWIDVLEGREELAGLSGILNRELGYIRKEDYEPNPHLTIGRVRSGRKRDELLGELGKLRHVKLCEVNVNEVKLKRSVLGDEGPAYSDLKVFPLG